MGANAGERQREIRARPCMIQIKLCLLARALGRQLGVSQQLHQVLLHSCFELDGRRRGYISCCRLGFALLYSFGEGAVTGDQIVVAQGQLLNGGGGLRELRMTCLNCGRNPNVDAETCR